jgi:hypothetical protein
VRLFSPSSPLRSSETRASLAHPAGKPNFDASPPLAARFAGWTPGTVEALKWFAFAAMAADHWAILVLADPFHPLRSIGRLALPIFLILLARNLAAGAGVGRYMMRLLPFALAAEIAWRAAEHAGAFRPPGANILFTLALAVLFWASLRRAAESGGLGAKLVAAFPALVALVLSTRADYGPTALVFVGCVALLLLMPLPWSGLSLHRGQPLWGQMREGLQMLRLESEWFLRSGGVRFVRAASPAAGRGHAGAHHGGWLIEATLWAGLCACAAILAVALNQAFFGRAALVAVLPLGLLLARRLPDIAVPRVRWWVFYALYPLHIALLGLLGAALRA